MSYPVPYGPVTLPAPRDPMPVGPVAYPQMLRTPRATPWRGVLMIVCFVVAYLVLSVVLQGAALRLQDAHRLAQAARHVGQLARAEQQQDHHDHDRPVHRAQSTHRLHLTAVGPRQGRTGARLAPRW